MDQSEWICQADFKRGIMVLMVSKNTVDAARGCMYAFLWSDGW